MAQLGSGQTTDTTSTSNEIYYAGEGFRINYNVGVTEGRTRTNTDLTNYTITANAIKVDVTDNDLKTVSPDSGGTEVTLVVDKTDGANGNFFVFVPTDILGTSNGVGYTLAPLPGSPAYIAYTVEYVEGGSSPTKETRVIESDVLGFRYNAKFTI